MGSLLGVVVLSGAKKIERARIIEEGLCIGVCMELCVGVYGAYGGLRVWGREWAVAALLCPPACW